MKTCAKCKVQNPDDAKFCWSCGSKFPEPRKCSCGFDLTPFEQNIRFCPNCGKSTTTSPNEKNSIPLEPSVVCHYNESDIATRIKLIVADKLEVDESEVTYSTYFTDLGADSLDAVELIMEFEKEFGISIPDDSFEDIKTVGDAIRYIKRNI